MDNIDLLKMKIGRYEKALEEIANAGEQANPIYLTILAVVLCFMSYLLYKKGYKIKS